MITEILEYKIGTKIDTFMGEAIYLHTEIEDVNGRWNDNWEINDGHFVIHDCESHHVYKVKISL